MLFRSGDTTRRQRVTSSAFTQARQKFSHNAFIEINQNVVAHFYQQYKRQKQWLEIENFSGRSVHAIRQDFHAKQVTNNLTAMLTHASQNPMETRQSARQHTCKINFAQALSRMKDSVVLLLLKHDLAQRIKKLLQYFSQTVEAVRKRRHFKRRMSNLHHNLHHMAYKACR